MLGKLRQLLEIDVAANTSVERRSAARAPAGPDAQIKIDSKVYALENWGASGFVVDGFSGSMVMKQRFAATLMIREGEQTIEFRTDAVVVRAEGKKLGAKFLFLSPEAKRAIESRVRRATA
jgi:hypothetical protein